MPETTWTRAGQAIIVVGEWAYGVWWRKPGESRLRWTRKSKFYLWRHAATKDSAAEEVA